MKSHQMKLRKTKNPAAIFYDQVFKPETADLLVTQFNELGLNYGREGGTLGNLSVTRQPEMSKR